MPTMAIDTTHVPWEPATEYPTGTEMKVLRRGPRREPLTVVLKLPPGFSLHRHSHVVDEHHFVLEGRIEADGQVLERGSYQIIPAHAQHGPFRSTRGAELLVIWAR